MERPSDQKSSRKKPRKEIEEAQKILESRLAERYRNYARAVPDASADEEITFRARFQTDEHGVSVIFEPDLNTQIQSWFTELFTHENAYRSGRVYCYFCESNTCLHAAPDQEGEVFAGYQSNGIPDWVDFLQVVLAKNDPDIGILFDEPGGVIALPMRGRDLKQRLLPGFGKRSKSYDILYQVVMGYFSLRTSAVSFDRTDRIAMTLQAVESRDAEGLVQLNINLLVKFRDEYILDYMAESPYRKLFKAIHHAREKVADIETILRNTPPPEQSACRRKLLPGIPGIMNEIARTLRHYNRQSHRRTEHADQRIQDDRPITSAYRDVINRSGQIFWDNWHQTIAVPGPRQRIHIFSPGGRHITSLKLPWDKIQSRLSRKRWTILDGQRQDDFIVKIKAMYDRTGG